MMKKGFTLVELIIVVIIIGILATIAVPQYMKAVERARSGKARSALVMISNAEKMYGAEWNGLYTAVNSGGLVASGLNDYVEMSDINADIDWDYTVTVAANSFLVIATKKNGLPNQGETVILSNAGVWSGTFTP